MVRVEALVLDGFERGREQRRNVLRRDDQAIFAVRREQAADQEGVQAHDRRVGALFVAQPRDAAARERDRHEPRGLIVASELEAARRDFHAPQADAIRAGRGQARILAITEPLELGHEVVLRKRTAGV